jgi:hypothetical protein
MKYWETIADNLSKAGWIGATLEPLTATGEQSGLLMRTATMGSASLCERTTG